MIKIEKNTLQQEVWFPRTERGNNTFRKTYQDGFDDGYQDGMASQKVKLYDGMKLAYSTIGSLDVFDFSDVVDIYGLFSHCKFTEDFYNFSKYPFITNADSVDETFSNFECYKDNCKFIMKFKKMVANNTFYGCNGNKNGILDCTLTEKVKEMNGWFGYNSLFKKIDIYADFSQCTKFYRFFSYSDAYSFDGREINFHHFDMSMEKDVTEDIFNSNNKRNVIRIDDTSPRSTFTRLLDDGTRYSHLDWTYCYGKERWTYDTIKKEWVLSGYDD